MREKSIKLLIHYIQVENAIVVELEDGLYAVNFVPYELGVHTVSVMYRDVDIPGSPFQFTVIFCLLFSINTALISREKCVSLARKRKYMKLGRLVCRAIFLVKSKCHKVK